MKRGKSIGAMKVNWLLKKEGLRCVIDAATVLRAGSQLRRPKKGWGLTASLF